MIGGCFVPVQAEPLRGCLADGLSETPGGFQAGGKTPLQGRHGTDSVRRIFFSCYGPVWWLLWQTMTQNF